MDELWYTHPSAKNLKSPTVETMIGLMRQEDGYWRPSSPVGVLCWHRAKKRTAFVEPVVWRQKLLFVRHPRRGWYFEYSTENSTKDRWLVPLAAGANTTRYAQQSLHGQPVHLLAGCFVPQVVAEQVVTDFLGAGGPSPVVIWMPAKSLAPRLTPSAYRALRKQLRKDA